MDREIIERQRADLYEEENERIRTVLEDCLTVIERWETVRVPPYLLERIRAALRTR